MNILTKKTSNANKHSYVGTTHNVCAQRNDYNITNKYTQSEDEIKQHTKKQTIWP